MVEDAERIRLNYTAGTIYFCTNVHLSEKEKLASRRKLQAILGRTFVVNVLSQEELAEAAAIRFPGAFEELYAVEVHELRRRLAEVASEAGGGMQLQIAHLLTSAEGFGNRDTVSELMVVEMLARRPSTVNEVCVGLQALLRIPASFPRYVVESALDRLSKRGAVSLLGDGRYDLAAEGRRDRASRLEGSSAAEKDRRERFSKDVESRLGHSIARDQQDRLWQRLIEEMSVLLSRVGARFVALVEAARTNSDLNAVRILASDNVRAACRAAVAGITDARTREETEEALYQSLLGNPTIALEWLEGIVAAWLTACQLGLVPEVSQQLRPAIQRIVLALDTDIVLSLLCEAEPDNGPLTALLTHWAAGDGRTLVATEVLKEVAHHAWIARVEFEEISSIIKKVRYDQGLARQIARNAFVRSFWASGRPVTGPEFDRYIRSYAGARVDDTSAVEATLARLSLGRRITEPTAADMSPFRHLEPKVQRVLARAARFVPDDPSGGVIAQDKMNRDAAAIVKYAAAAHEASSSVSSLLLLSSSRRLGLAVRQGAPNARVVVAPTSTLGLLMAAISTLYVSPLSVAQLLLAEGAREQVGYVRSELTRMLARADLLATLPRARIVSLEREVETGIADYARKASRSRMEVRRDVLSASDKDASLTVMADALRKSALGAEADRLIRVQQEELARLRSNARPIERL